METKTKTKLEKVDIMIIGESSLAALALYGVRHPFEKGDILPAVIITKEYCEENEGFKEGFFIQGHGPLPECYCTKKITKKRLQKIYR